MRQAERTPLSDIESRRFAGTVVLDRVCTTPGAFHAGLLEQEDDHLLDDTFKYLLAEGIVDIGEDDHYFPTDKGWRAYQSLIHQRQSYLVHFEVFAGVDLAAGTFAEQPKDFLGDSRWNDLRVAVAEYKGIDPYRIVFLAMLAEEQFFSNSDWKFDLALGSSFFREMEEIVASQISVEELGYTAEDGSQVSGESVIEDVILQGAAINQQRMEQEAGRQQTMLVEEPFEEEEEATPSNGSGQGKDKSTGTGDTTSTGGWEFVPYDPWAPLAGYAGSAVYVEPFWLSSYW